MSTFASAVYHRFGGPGFSAAHIILCWLALLLWSGSIDNQLRRHLDQPPPPEHCNASTLWAPFTGIRRHLTSRPIGSSHPAPRGGGSWICQLKLAPPPPGFLDLKPHQLTTPGITPSHRASSSGHAVSPPRRALLFSLANPPRIRLLPTHNPQLRNSGLPGRRRGCVMMAAGVQVWGGSRCSPGRRGVWAAGKPRLRGRGGPGGVRSGGRRTSGEQQFGQERLVGVVVRGPPHWRV